MGEASGPYLAEEDGLLVELIEEAVRPYDGLFGEDERRFIREALADALATHPETASLLEQLRKRPIPESSGPVEKGASAPSESDERKESASGGER